MWRRLAGAGLLEQFVVEVVAQLPLTRRQQMFRVIRLLCDREKKLYGPRRGERVGIMYLSDGAIRDKINDHACRRRRQDRLSGWWDSLSRRDLTDVFLEEAEWRGLKTKEEETWEGYAAMAPGELAGVLSRIVRVTDCSERSHSFEWLALDDLFVCFNCRRKVKYEVVAAEIKRRVDGLLAVGLFRDAARRLRPS